MMLFPAGALGHGLGILSGWFIPILYGALGALPSILILFADFDRSTDNIKSRTVNAKNADRNVYDFIVGKLLLRIAITGFDLLIVKMKESPARFVLSSILNNSIIKKCRFIGR